jgi:hypothetical protein
MKTLLLSAVMVSSAALLSAQSWAPWERVGDAAEDLRRATSRLADRSAQDVLESRSNAAGNIHEALLAQQLHASATLLADMVRGRRPGSELREVTTAIVHLSERAPGGSRGSTLWRNVQSAVAEVDRDLGGRRVGGIPPPAMVERPIVGRMTWRGWVDDRVHLVIKGQSIETRTLSGSPRPESYGTFTSPLPASMVEVAVEKTRGRGTATIVQQPSPVNDYTTVVEIYDGNGGAYEYRLDVFWR